MAKVLRLVLACVALIGVFAGFASFQPGDHISVGLKDEVTLIGATFLGGNGTDDSYEPSIAVADDSSIYGEGIASKHSGSPRVIWLSLREKLI